MEEKGKEDLQGLNTKGPFLCLSSKSLEFKKDILDLVISNTSLFIINEFNKYLLTTCFVSDTTLGTGEYNSDKKQQTKVFVLLEFTMNKI